MTDYIKIPIHESHKFEILRRHGEIEIHQNGNVVVLNNKLHASILCHFLANIDGYDPTLNIGVIHA